MTIFQLFGRDRIGGFTIHDRDEVGDQRPDPAVLARDEILVLKFDFHPSRPPEGVDGGAADRKAAARLALQIDDLAVEQARSEEHTSELQSLMRISYAVFCLKKKNLFLIMLLHIYLTLLY